MRQLVRVLGQSLVVEGLGLFRIQAEVELVLLAELEARLAQRGAGAAFGDDDLPVPAKP